ncbi:MAG: hypothetical protein ACR2QT_12415, partial [Woeseiaceae bacterium]
VLHWLLQRFPFSGTKTIGLVFGRVEAQTMWITLLEPHHKSYRLPLAVIRAVIRRIRTMIGSMLRAIAG